MSNNVNHLELVRKAQLGSQESLSRLIRLSEGRVYAYIYRLTLNHHLTEDLSQDTLLELVKSLKSLRFEHVNQFWSWLYRTALSKIQRYFGKQGRKRTVQMSIIDKEHLSKFASQDYNDGLSNIIRKELSEAIFEAVGKLKFRHRNVLVLRCFEQMPYSEIAVIMGCSEIAAQVLFFRAKRSLKRQLSKHGFGRGLLLMAMGLFARMTTPAQAAHTGSVTAASVKVGFAAAVIGAAGTKLGITIGTAVIAIALTVGGIAAVNKTAGLARRPGTNISSNLVLSRGTFEYPYQLVNASDPDGDGWKGIEADETVSGPVLPQKWLVGPPPSEQSSVVLPVGHWIELKFKGEIVDGPGDDIFIVEWGAKAEQARIFITDGAGNEYLLGTAKAGDSSRQVATEIGFDIAGISLPFVPYAVRILGTKAGGGTLGFDLHSVRARTYINQNNF